MSSPPADPALGGGSLVEVGSKPDGDQLLMKWSSGKLIGGELKPFRHSFPRTFRAGETGARCKQAARPETPGARHRSFAVIAQIGTYLVPL